MNVVEESCRLQETIANSKSEKNGPSEFFIEYQNVVNSGKPLNPTESSGTVDSELADFFSLVGSIPEPVKKRITHLPGFLFRDGKDQPVDPDNVSQGQTNSVPLPLTFGTGSEECERLTKKVFTNAYEVLNLPVDATEDDVKRAFKKISLIVHPDKCQHEKAQEAFHVVNTAYEDLQKPEMKDKYKTVLEEAKKRVLKEVMRKNKILAKESKPLLGTENSDIQDQVTTMCETLLQELNENLEYAEKCRKANEAYEKEAEESVLEEERKEQDRKKKWEETRDSRVGCWRDFKEGVATKRVKLAAFVPVTHRREQRKEGDKSVPSKPRGIDETYKQNWR